MPSKAVRIYDWFKAKGPELDGSIRDLTVLPMQEILSFPYIASVRIIDLSSNRLTVIPEQFAPRLTQIEKLILSNNFLTYLPDSFGQLVNLKVFRCTNNKICRLPPSFVNLEALTILDLSFNPLVHSYDSLDGKDQWSPECCTKAAIEVRHILRRLNEIRRIEKEQAAQSGTKLSTEKIKVVSSLSISCLDTVKCKITHSGRRKAASGTSSPTESPTTELWLPSESELPGISAVENPLLAPSQTVYESTAPVAFEILHIANTNHSSPSDRPNGSLRSAIERRDVDVDDLDRATRCAEAAVQQRIDSADRIYAAIRASVESLRIEKRPDWQARSLAAMLIVMKGLIILFYLSFAMACFIDQIIVDTFLTQNFDFIPVSLLSFFSNFQDCMQENTNKFSPFFPLVRAPVPEGNFAMIFRILVSGLFSLATFFARFLVFPTLYN